MCCRMQPYFYWTSREQYKQKHYALNEVDFKYQISNNCMFEEMSTAVCNFVNKALSKDVWQLYCKKLCHKLVASSSQAPLLYWESYLFCVVSCNETHVFSSHQCYQFNKTSVVPFFGLASLLSLPSLSSLSSRSLQRRTCSSLIFKKRILFCSSLRASSTSGSTHMSSRILANILSLFPVYHRWQVSPSSGSCFSGVLWLLLFSCPLQSQVPFSLTNVGSGAV